MESCLFTVAGSAPARRDRKPVERAVERRWSTASCEKRNMRKDFVRVGPYKNGAVPVSWAKLALTFDRPVLTVN